MKKLFIARTWQLRHRVVQKHVRHVHARDIHHGFVGAVELVASVQPVIGS